MGVVEDVLGLHVAVHDPRGVGAAEGLSERDAERARLLDGECTAREARAERAPGEEGHGEVHTAREAARVDEGDEPLLLAERGEEPHLAPEARRRLGVPRGDELDGDLAPAGRAGAVDHADAAASELLEDLVGTEPHPWPLWRAAPR